MANEKIDWTSKRADLAIRANYRCEGCGLPFEPHPVFGFSASHRFPRGGGIKADWVHGLANLTLFCGQGNEGMDTCHGKCKADFDTSLVNGWVISRFDRRLPSEIPVLFYNGWHLLDDNGGKARIGS